MIYNWTARDGDRGLAANVERQLLRTSAIEALNCCPLVAKSLWSHKVLKCSTLDPFNKSYG